MAQETLTLSPGQEALLIHLNQFALLTEHELTDAVAKRLNQQPVEVQRSIGKILLTLKDLDLVWAGKVFKRDETNMWCAVITKRGKEWANAESKK